MERDGSWLGIDDGDTEDEGEREGFGVGALVISAKARSISPPGRLTETTSGTWMADIASASVLLDTPSIVDSSSTSRSFSSS